MGIDENSEAIPQQESDAANAEPGSTPATPQPEDPFARMRYDPNDPYSVRDMCALSGEGSCGFCGLFIEPEEWKRFWRAEP